MLMNPVALITGAGRGIGRQLALRLAADGYAIAAVDLDAGPLAELQREMKTPFAAMAADVTNADALADAVRQLEQRLGPVSLLIANAGIGLETSALDYRAADVNRVLNVNLLGVSNSIAAVLPGMIERKAGHIVGMSSLASFRGMPRMLAYCASKAGVNSLLDGLRAELRPIGIHVTIVCPGWIRTDMTAEVAEQLPELLELDDGVRRILRAIREKRIFHAFPFGMALQLRVLNCLPRSWQDRILGRMARRLKNKDQLVAVEPDKKI